MVNRLTAIQVITRLIQTQNISSMRRWSLRFNKQRHSIYSGYFIKLKKEIRNILEIISGKEIIPMMKGFFSLLNFFF